MTGNDNSVNIKVADGSVSDAGDKPQRYHHGNLRDALISAGLTQLESRGLDALSLREMARQAGVSATAVYRHFPDKAALLKALAGYGIRDLGERQLRAEAAVEGPGEGFIAAGLAYIRFAVERPALFRLAMAHAPDEDQLAAPLDRVAPAMRLLRNEVAALIPAAEDDAVRRAVALRAWALVHGLSQLILDGFVVWEPVEIEAVLRGLGEDRV
jgi:AcrR family transcriptional regulator